MRLTYDIYRAVKLLDESQTELTANLPPESRNAHKRSTLTTPVLIDYYKDNRKITHLQAEKILTQAVKEKYIDVDTSDEGNSVLTPSDKGYRIIDTTLKLPTGLIAAWWENDKTTVKVIIAIASGVVGYFIVGLIRFLIDKLINYIG